MKKNRLSAKLRNNWWIDFILFMSAVFILLSSIYFLILPVGGYMGGRNPNYGIVFIMERSGWELLHNWGGLLMIIIALVHILFHWKWIYLTTKRVIDRIGQSKDSLGSRLAWNITLDAIILISFLVCAISGLFFFFGGKYSTSPILFSSLTWDLIHNWSGILMIMAVILHFVLHWKWIVNVSQKIISKRKLVIQDSINTKTSSDSLSTGS